MAILTAICCGNAMAAGKKPLKVYILAGQSNMVGAGLIHFDERRTEGFKKQGMSDEEIAQKRKGVLESLVKDPEKENIYKHIIDKDGKWIVRRDVHVFFKRGRDAEPKKGGLSVGFGARDSAIGPEFQFGHVMGDFHDEPVLLIKTAWGGKSLAFHFRPPSAGKPGFEIKPGKDGTIPKPGEYYRLMMAEVKEVLSKLEKHVPEYNGQGYEIAGFCWHQGWNDGCNQDWAEEYARNMPIFIRDVRKDLGVASLPFVIANSGFGGYAPKGGVVGRLQKMVQPAQAAAAKTMDNVQCVETRDFYRAREESPGRGDIEHWFSNAESYFLIGDAMGKAMKQLLSTGEN
jgi:alpha-galactosidase